MEKVKDVRLPPENKVYRNQLVTLGDLQEFKEDLLLSFKAIILANAPSPSKKWLKSYEVRKLLNISSGTLQNLRANRILPFTKMGGLIYYDSDEINKLLAGQKKEFEAGAKTFHKK